MIKRLLHIVFAIYMIMLISGINIYKHYCSGELITTSLSTVPHECCKGACPFCSDEVETYKTSSEIITQAFNFIEDIDFEKISFEYPLSIFIKLNTEINPTSIHWIPPLLNRIQNRELAKIQVFQI